MSEDHAVAFWYARFAVDAGKSDDIVYFAVEVLRLDVGAYFVALSNVNEPPFHELTCFAAFANTVEACDLGRELGFPVVEAEMTYRVTEDVGVLEVVTPFIPDANAQAGGASASTRTATGTSYESRLLVIRGVDLDKSSLGERFDAKGLPDDFMLTYCQSMLAPDPAQPDDAIPVDLPPFASRRVAEIRRYGTIKLTLTPARQPDLLPLVSGAYEAEIWSGNAPHQDKLPGTAHADASGHTSAAGSRSKWCRGAGRRPLPGSLAHRAYRFEDMEVLGFRIDLRDRGKEVDQVLDSLIAPLNFHREASMAPGRRGAGLACFRYRAASRTLVVELLRYGKMRYRMGRSERLRRSRLRPGDYGSQHELLVRVLVGRLDDDTAQARNPAVFVPAIFVDNAISKVVGRELRGFKKQLACFCVGDGRGGHEILRPDGRLRGRGDDDPAIAAPELPQPLTDVSQVRRIAKVGRTDGHSVIDLDLESAHLDDEEFSDLDLAFANRRSRLSGVRWQQSDFNAAEFRRAFARPVVADGVSGMRSVQVSPVDHRTQQKLWIQGSFIATRSAVAYPHGIVSLALHSHGMPQPWRQIQQLLGGTSTRPARVDLPTGDWYRMKLALDLFIDDGLNW